jgi:hypothetical protein
MNLVYNALTIEDCGPSYKKIWKGRIPAKVKIFMWLLENKAILTKDNMIRRKWVGEPKCSFCDQNESIDHLFFECPVARAVWGIIALCFRANTIPRSLDQFWVWIKSHFPHGEKVFLLGGEAICWAIWKTRNKACFDNKRITHPAEIICYACCLMTYWAGLYPEGMQESIHGGAQSLVNVARTIAASTKCRCSSHCGRA